MSQEDRRPYIDFDLVAPEACRGRGCQWSYASDENFLLVIIHNGERVLEIEDMVTPDDWRVRNEIVQHLLADDDFHADEPTESVAPS